MKISASIFFISICIILQSCHLGGSGTSKNGDIDQSVKNEITFLNRKLFRAVSSKNAGAIKELMSPKLAEKSGPLVDTLVRTYSASLNALNYKVLDEYYIRNANNNVPNTLVSEKGNYKIDFPALNNEMYVSVLIAKSFPVSVMALAIYGKYDDGWKLNILQVGEYSILDKTAPDYYNLALKDDTQGDVIDAAGMILTASQIINPAGSYFRYNNEAAINNLYTKVLKEADDKYQFPVDVSGVKTKPQIFAVMPQLIDGGKNKGVFPMVKYKSSIPVADTVALKVENKALQKAIGGMFKGIDANNSYIIYQVFNQIPDGVTPVKHYGFVQKTADH